MMRLIVIVLVAIAAMPAYAQVQRKVRPFSSLPPVQYDTPYPNEIWIRRFHTEQEIHLGCKEVSKFACARTGNLPAGEVAPRCDLMMLTDKQLRAKGGSSLVALTWRHELGHCNGWRGHDGGRRVFYLETHVDMPKLPASVHELPAYPPAVCVTPEWKEESCKARVPQS
jgi:hypothetical protein